MGAKVPGRVGAPVLWPSTSVFLGLGDQGRESLGRADVIEAEQGGRGSQAAETGHREPRQAVRGECCERVAAWSAEWGQQSESPWGWSLMPCPEAGAQSPS